MNAEELQAIQALAGIGHAQPGFMPVVPLAPINMPLQEPVDEMSRVGSEIGGDGGGYESSGSSRFIPRDPHN